MAHAAPTAPRRHRQTAVGTSHLDKAALARPLLMGLVYGVYAAFMKRQTGPVDAGNVFYGILCGAIFAACLVALARIGPRLRREVHAAMYGAFAGIAFGYLYSLSGESVLKSSGISLVVGAGVGIAAFYRYYTREPA
ncbi:MULTISPECIES: hypothetical protein [unclassified Streptomyces]|uniref:hypothetical protein n=1 Tax=unclassified Streptomyces TaxID=2593676 RepID=UPI000DC78B7A|nr:MULTISPECIES: hypothetical protein [unclassified Streptomyces]AWZ09341.1 hypothetical protein DRB89_38205 [Streptomyces sp. ICC4]AWZ16725.1 hypothetical protein DRB96_36105 [Streptomyces sp. ICC1]